MQIWEDFYSAQVRQRSVAISQCVRVYSRAYLWNRWTDLQQIFLCLSPMAMARSSSGDVTIRYVLPVLWMMSHLAVMDHVTYLTLGRSLMSMVALLWMGWDCGGAGAWGTCWLNWGLFIIQHGKWKLPWKFKFVNLENMICESSGLWRMFVFRIFVYVSYILTVPQINVAVRLQS